MTIQVKICGLSTFDSVRVAVKAGADYIGFVLFNRSPRFVTPRRAAELGGCARNGTSKVGLVVDADDSDLDAAVSQGNFDMLQLHGNETPERIAEIRAKFGLPVIKALAIADASDVAASHAYEQAADMLLFDARPPADADRPGGNAVCFDWRLLSAQSWPIPWMLAGGLNAENLQDAVGQSGATRVDVSSGVEDRPGVKNNDMIREFLDAAKRC